jgi:hypothetical protein
MMTCPLFKLCVGNCCVFKRAHLKTEKKRAANNFLNCRTDRIDNQRLSSASSQTWLRQTFGDCFLWLLLLGIFVGLIVVSSNKYYDFKSKRKTQRGASMVGKTKVEPNYSEPPKMQL